ncbi:MAG: hypothetical protein JXP73_13895 [Deltaproteobacteria bacterium]|nr:hypothetical protein [Deltaproteobacteria bacterium]
MAAGTFTLADRLGAKSLPCRVPGCTRTYIQLSSKVLGLGRGDGDPASEGMCEPCREKARRVRDVERRCDRPGCNGTWIWTAAAQLEAFASEKPAPKQLCAACQALLDSLEDKQIPCAVPGCTRTALLTRQQQLLAQGQPEATPEPPKPGAVTLTGPMCEPCAAVAQRIRDREINCGINGCTRKWVWKADEQIAAFAAGKPNEPPRRMCDVCRANFGRLVDREIRCRTSGCKNTWTWSRYDQLDACVADKPPPKAPSHMCQRCFELWGTLKDIERPCRRAGCKGTWIDKRGAQLARAVRGKSGDPYPRLCPDCEKDLGDLEDREIPCRTENCPGTFTWTREQQLAAGVRPKLKDIEPQGEAAAPAVAENVNPETGADAAPMEPRAGTAEDDTAAPPPAVAPADGKPKKNKRKRRREIQPPERRCAACAEFLANRKTQEIPCTQCGTPIFWPPESQLQTHLGNWAAPTLCGACKLVQVQAAREAAREMLRHSHPQPGETAPAADAAPQDPAPEGEPSSESTDSDGVAPVTRPGA